MINIKKDIIEQARQLGFELVGITTADPLESERIRYLHWLTQEYAGSMSYLYRQIEKKLNPRKVMPGANSVICLGMNYYHEAYSSLSSFKISRYAHVQDYHQVLKSRLESLENYIHDCVTPTPLTASFVDSGPLLERQLAARAGLGFIGKNTFVINPYHGSWFFLGFILTSLELEPDDIIHVSCGNCRRCIDACPTGAFYEPYKLDARKCISFLTIENKEAILLELRSFLGKWVFGCDICQEVCPFNQKAESTSHSEFKPENGQYEVPTPENLISLSNPTKFNQEFSHSPLARPKREGLLRNMIIASGNSKDKEHLLWLNLILTGDFSESLREQAQWAINQINTESP